MPRGKKTKKPVDTVQLESSRATSAALPKPTFDDLADAICYFDIPKIREILEHDASLVFGKTSDKHYSALDILLANYDRFRPPLEDCLEILRILRDNWFDFTKESPRGFYPIDFTISKNYVILAKFLHELGAKLDHKVTAVDLDYENATFIFAWDERYNKGLRNKYLNQFITEDFATPDVELMLKTLGLEPYSSPPKAAPWKAPSLLARTSQSLTAPFQMQIAAATITPGAEFQIELDSVITGSLKEFCSLVLKRGISVTCNTITHGLIFVSADDSYDSFGKPRPILHVPSDEVESFSCEDGSVSIVGDLLPVLD